MMGIRRQAKQSLLNAKLRSSLVEVKNCFQWTILQWRECEAIHFFSLALSHQGKRPNKKQCMVRCLQIQKCIDNFIFVDGIVENIGVQRLKHTAIGSKVGQGCTQIQSSVLKAGEFELSDNTYLLETNPMKSKQKRKCQQNNQVKSFRTPIDQIK